MKWFRDTTLFIFIALLLVPLLFVIIGATQDAGWAFRQSITWWPGNQLENNFVYINEIYDLTIILINSIAVALLTALLSTIIILSAAYAFTKLKFRYKNILQVIFISTAFLPAASILIGQLKTMSTLGIYGSIVGLILPFIINIRTFVYLMNISKYIPDELIEAARVDGANEYRVFIQISMPIIKDKILLSFFMLFVASWNNFLIPMITITSETQFTIPVMISSLADPLSYNTGSTMLALVLSIMPIIMVYGLLCQQINNTLQQTIEEK